MDTYFTKKEQIVILIIVILIISILGFKFAYGMFKGKGNDEVIVDFDEGKEPIEETDELSQDLEEKELIETEEFQGNIIVHISGQVINPGIVELPYGKRLIDAVEILGGLTLEADADRINLAKKLQDEEKIYIPKIGEELEELIILNSGSSNGDSNAHESKDSNGNGAKVDINTCSKEELNSLPGIGDVLSTRIIDYREENLFKSIDDIMNVSGIGAKKFEGIKELIKVK